MSHEPKSSSVPATDVSGRLDRPSLRALVALLLLTALAGAPGLSYGFVRYDDPIYVLDNPLVVAPSGVSVLDRLTTPALGYPMPLTVATYRLEYLVAGHDSALLPHLVNLGLHLCSVALLFVLARGAGLATRAAVVAAGLLALHPVVAEPVTWVTGRKDVLALSFGLLATTVALRGAGRPEARGARWLRFLALVGAMAAKPTAVAFVPVVALARAGWPGAWSREALLARLRPVAPEALLAVALLPVAYLSHARYGGLRLDESVATSVRAAWHGLGLHLGLLVGVVAPCADHMPDVLPPPFRPEVDLLPLGLAPFLWAALRLARPARRGFVAFALASAALMYLPSSGVVPMNRFAADSYVYPVLPWLGLVLAELTEALLEARPEFARLGGWLTGAFVAFLALLYVPSAGRFASTQALWSSAMEQHPNRWRVCKDWATATREVAGPDAVLANLDYCIARFGPARFEKNRALALYELGREDEAAVWLRRALRTDPRATNVPPELLRLAREPDAAPGGTSGPGPKPDEELAQ